MKNAATWYRRSGTALLAWALAACGAAGQTITNGSFEAQGFGVSPGYISLNSEITGWSGSPTDRVGLNPAGGTNALANNGVIPQGTNVAFIQGTSVLSTTIADLTPGQQYKVDFRINAKLTNLPVLRLAIDGAPLMNLSCTNVTGSNPYRYAAVAFTASAASHTLSMTNDAATNTVMVDDFTVAAYTDGWSYAIWTNDATTGISSTNNVTHAYNFGGTVASNTTINGVFFRGIAGVNPYASNSFTTAGFGSQYTSDDPNNITTNAGGSAALGRRFVYGGNPGAITLNGLVPGQEYVATLYTVGWEVGQRAQTLSRGTDRLTVNQDHYGNNIGLRILYRYIAPSNGTVALSQSPLASASSLHLYGLANFEAGTNVLPIVSAPRSLAGAPGLPAVFTVAGGGAQPLFYQWLKEGSPLTDQTNRILTLAAIADGDLGAYAAIVSNAYGVVTSSVASLTYAATIANPSFEADTFHNAPGYISSNTPISGWTANNPARSGLNPLIDGNSPFANNGTIPDGAQVAFLQSGSPSSALSTAISGLTIGNTYRLNFRANARASSGTAIMRVALDGTRYVDAAVTSAGNLYKPVAFEFTAAGTSMVLAVSNDQALATPPLTVRRRSNSRMTSLADTQG